MKTAQLTTVGRHATKGLVPAPGLGLLMTRDDLERLDTASLRALALEHLASRAKSLRTRRELLAALTLQLVPALAPPKPGRRRLSSLKSAPNKPSPREAGATVGQLPTSTAVVPRAPEAAAQRVSVPVPPDDVLVEEGFFVFHAQQRRPARQPLPNPKPKPPVRRPPPPPAGRQLPLGDEVPHLLARDPTTLFLFWDFQRDLERGAAFGLQAPRVLFRLYDGEVLVRTVEAPLGRRSLYLEGLSPGHTYSVEAWLAGRDGHARPTGRRSAPLRLAPAAPSGQLEVHMVRVPWEKPLASPSLGEGGAAQLPLAVPARVELPASLEWRGGPGPSGPHSGRP